MPQNVWFKLVLVLQFALCIRGLLIVRTISHDMDHSRHRRLYSNTQSFSFSGQQLSFVVPAGVSSIYVEAYGAAGGGSEVSGANPGLGAKVSSTLTVTPGST